MISKINFCVILLLSTMLFNLTTGCSNSLTERGESQTQETIDESFPDVDDELSVADNEDLSDEDFESFDESNVNEDLSVGLNEESDLNDDFSGELDVEDSGSTSTSQSNKDNVNTDIADLESELEDFSDSELDVDTNTAGDVFDIEDDDLSLNAGNGGASDSQSEDPFADFEESPSDNLVTKDQSTEDPFAEFLSEDLDSSPVVQNDSTTTGTEEDPLFNLEDENFDDTTSTSSEVVPPLTDSGFSDLTSENDLGLTDTTQDVPPATSELNDNLDDAFSDVISAPINDDLLVADIPGQNKLTTLEYNSQNANGVVVIKAEKPITFSTQYDSTTSQFILNLQDVVVPSILQRPLYLKDFKQSFGAVKATPVSNGLVQVVVKVNNNKEPNILSNGKEILVSPGTEVIFGKVSKVSDNIDLNPMMNVETQISQNLNLPTNNVEGENALTASTLEEFLLESGSFYGEPINLQVNDEEITTVIGFIADYSGANIVIAPGVSGKITIKLRNVPWDQALLTIMKTRGLGYVRTGNVLRIAPLTELQTEAQAAVEVRRSQIQIEPTLLKVIPLEYANSTEIIPQVTPFLTKDRGSVTEDKRTSSIVLNDTRAVIAKVSKLIKELDLPPPQVLVESKIVEATKNFVQTLGVRWGMGGQATQLSPTGGQNNGAINITPSLNINRTLATDGLIQNQPLTGTLNIGVLDFLGNIDAAIGISETDEQVRVISSPRVTTLNNTEATIIQSSEILRVRTVVNEGLSQTEVTAVPVQLQLKVTPQITSGSSVLMQIDVKNEFPGAPVEGQSPKNSRQALARVLVESNKTAVIGGIYDKSSTIINVGVPFFKDIPFLGWMFKTKNVSKRDTEIMIFITPRIIDKNYSTSASSNIN